MEGWRQGSVRLFLPSRKQVIFVSLYAIPSSFPIYRPISSQILSLFLSFLLFFFLPSHFRLSSVSFLGNLSISPIFLVPPLTSYFVFLALAGDKICSVDRRKGLKTAESTLWRGSQINWDIKGASEENGTKLYSIFFRKW